MIWWFVILVVWGLMCLGFTVCVWFLGCCVVACCFGVGVDLLYVIFKVGVLGLLAVYWLLVVLGVLVFASFGC